MPYADFEGEFNINLLGEELHPLCEPFEVTRPDGNRKGFLSVMRRPGGVRVKYPEGLAAERVASVVRAHNPTRLSRNESDRALRASLRKSARDKLLVLGLTDDEIRSVVAE